jgi:hypothetical protein
MVKHLDGVLPFIPKVLQGIIAEYIFEFANGKPSSLTYSPLLGITSVLLICCAQIVTIERWAGSYGIPDSPHNGDALHHAFQRVSAMVVDSKHNLIAIDTFASQLLMIPPGASGGNVIGADKHPVDSRQRLSDRKVRVFASNFNWPEDVCIDSKDNVYVADTGNRVLYTISFCRYHRIANDSVPDCYLVRCCGCV